MPYIPKFNKLSQQEIFYAPALMQQQGDIAATKNMELANELQNINYLGADKDIVEPHLQDYNTKIQNLSKKLVSEGYSPELKNDIMGLRNKYIMDDKLRTIQKNYAEGMKGWEETKRNLLAQKASGADVDAMKKAYFSGYKGAYDNDGFKQEFTPGKTSNVYDIGEDAKRLMTNLGDTGKVVGANGSTIQFKTVTNPSTGQPLQYYEITDNKTGQVIKNADQISAMSEFLKREYSDPNTDRGLYAQLTNKTPDYINNVVSDVARSMSASRYSPVPQSDTNIGGLGDLNGKPTGEEGIPMQTQTPGTADASVQKKYDNIEKTLTTPDEPSESQINEMVGKDNITKYGTQYGAPRDYSNKERLINGYKEDLAKKKEAALNQLKADFPLYFNEHPIQEAIKKSIEVGKNGAALQNASLFYNIPNKETDSEGTTGRLINVLNMPGVSPFTKVDNRNIFSNSYSKEEFKDKVWGKKEDYKRQPLQVDPNGNLYVRGPKDERYMVNPDALTDAPRRMLTEVIQPLQKRLKNINLFDNGDVSGDYRENNSPIFVVPNTNMGVRVLRSSNGDPYDLAGRSVQTFYINPDGSIDTKSIKTLPNGEEMQEMVSNMLGTTLGKNSMFINFGK